MTLVLRRVSLLLTCLASFGLMTLALPHSGAAADENRTPGKHMPRALAGFGGLLTNNHWEDALVPWTLDFRGSALLGIAASHSIGQFDRRLVFEAEGQVVRHFGDQDHWEFNLPIIGRWNAFPWNEVVDTSLAFGIGPSYASEKPKVEVANNGDSHRLLVYWMMEFEGGPPAKAWRAILRFHHRSGAFGLVADEGGSNAIVIGLKRRF